MLSIAYHVYQLKLKKSFFLFFFFYLEEQIDHKQVFNGIGIKDKSSFVLFIVVENVVNRVDLEPRKV